MTAVAATGRGLPHLERSRILGGGRILVVMTLLAAAIATRRTLVVGGADGLLVGVGFGVALVGIGFTGGWRPGRPSIAFLARSAAVGSAAALALIALVIVGRAHGPWIPLDPAASLLRATEDVAGPAGAIAFTAAVFALLHVPLYGWAVVPLDLGVGVLLGGLRVLTGGVLAPVVAHVVADLAAWWL